VRPPFCYLGKVCCAIFLKEPIVHLFRYLSLRMLLCLPYLGERPLYFINWVRSPLFMSRRSLLLRMSSRLLYLRQSYFCHLFPLNCQGHFCHLFSLMLWSVSSHFHPHPDLGHCCMEFACGVVSLCLVSHLIEYLGLQALWCGKVFVSLSFLLSLSFSPQLSPSLPIGILQPWHQANPFKPSLRALVRTWFPHWHYGGWAPAHSPCSLPRAV
jgi:hypothetical protein